MLSLLRGVGGDGSETVVEFIMCRKTFVVHKMLHSSPLIEFYCILINKKINASQIQDKSRFSVTVFGDGKRIYDVKGL